MRSYFIRKALLLVERGFNNLEGFNHQIGLVMEKIQSLLLGFCR